MADTAMDPLEYAINTLTSSLPSSVNYSGVSMNNAKAAEDNVTRSVADEKVTLSDNLSELRAANLQYKQGTLDLAAAQGLSANADAATAAEVASKYNSFNGLTGIEEQLARQVQANALGLIATKPMADQELQEIHDMQSVGPLDDPLQWAVNQIQLPGKIKAYNSTADSINSAQGQVDASLKTINDISRGAVNSVPTISAAKAAATSAESLAKAKVLNAQADDLLATRSIDIASKRTAADIAAAGVTDNTTRLQQTEAENKFQAQISSIRLAESVADRAVKTQELTEKLTDQRQLQVILGNADVMRGLPRGTTNIQMLKFMPKADQDNMIALGSTQTYGHDLVDSLNTMETLKLKGDGLPPTTTAVFNFLRNQKEAYLTKATAETDQLIQAGKLTTEGRNAQIHAKLNSSLETALQAEMNKPDSSLFAPASPKVVFSTPPEMGGINPASPVGKLLAPLANTESPVDAKVITATLLEATSGTDTSINMTGAILNRYYKSAAAITNATSNIKAFGNNANKPTSYNVEINDPTTFFDSKIKLNLLDPAAANRYALLTAMQKQKDLQATQIQAGTFTGK